MCVCVCVCVREKENACVCGVKSWGGADWLVVRGAWSTEVRRPGADPGAQPSGPNLSSNGKFTLRMRISGHRFCC